MPLSVHGFLGLSCLALTSLALACGSSDSSSGQTATGGTTSGGNAGTGATGGSSSGGSGGTSGTSGSAGASGGSTGGAGGSTGGAGGASGTGGSAGACAGTPNTILCGTEVCNLDSQFCCGGTESGKCFATGAFCGAGGGLKMFCDDSADCAADEVCCPSEVENPGNDAPYQTTCVKPPPFPNDGPYGCGFTGGNLEWPSLCACDADCAIGTCQSGTILVPTIGGSTMRCE